MLRQPLENEKVTISRVHSTVTYPAKFIFLAAMNPCPCGYLGSDRHYCTCTEKQIKSYKTRISGPILDRMDILLTLNPVILNKPTLSDTSDTVRKRIEQARELQYLRYGKEQCNGSASMEELSTSISSTQLDTLQAISIKLGLSNRVQMKILRLARTISDLAAEKNITDEALEEAMSLRKITTHLTFTKIPSMIGESCISNKRITNNMPRKAREKSKSNIYHIIWRGANKQDIFHDDEDRIKFQDTLEKYHTKANITIYCWCLMSNHIHLLIKEGKEDIFLTMKRIGVSYALYFNGKYYTIGHLFQDRFRSEKVETDSYLLTVTRYIHQNPTKAGMVQKPEEWQWSSCRGYYGQASRNRKMLHTRYVLKLFSNGLQTARKRFKEYNEKTNNDQCLEEPTQIKRRLNDHDAKTAIQKILGDISIPQVKSLPRETRLPLLQKIKKTKGISQRQAARILGISANLIFKA